MWRMCFQPGYCTFLLQPEERMKGVPLLWLWDSEEMQGIKRSPLSPGSELPSIALGGRRDVPQTVRAAVWLPQHAYFISEAKWTA